MTVTGRTRTMGFDAGSGGSSGYFAPYASAIRASSPSTIFRSSAMRSGVSSRSVGELSLRIDDLGEGARECPELSRRRSSGSSLARQAFHVAHAIERGPQ